MKKVRFHAFLLACALSLAALCAASPVGANNGFEDMAGAAIGSTVADFKLPDVKGVERQLASVRGAKGTVLIFISVQCPVSNAYNARMEKLAQDYKGRGINVVGINSNSTESSDAIAEHALEKGFSFPVLKDNGNKIADRLGALVTPEAYFLDASNKLVYRGRIDNSRNGDAITSNDLRDALDAALAGKPIAKTEARAFGCSIKRAS
jgi:peroxiredoxin